MSSTTVYYNDFKIGTICMYFAVKFVKQVTNINKTSK